MTSTTASRTETGTAPLPPAAVEALAHAEKTLARWRADDLLAQHATTARTCQQLSASTDWMTAGEFDRLADVQDALAMYRTQLAAAGLDLDKAA